MNTSRVPGVTRNSGWQAVAAEILEARARVAQQGAGAPAGVRPVADRDGPQPEQVVEGRRAAPDAG